MNHSFEHAFPVGKYLVSPLTRLTESGRYTARVSIRSGRGQATHDRVLGFLPEFRTRESALQYAATEGQRWLQQRFCAA
jgi:hypothetical protein